MATIAVGDIHGNLEALQDLLAQLRGELRRGDTVVFLGDYIDRGPDSNGCVDAVLRFRGEVEADVVCLLGNHEDWMLRTCHDYRRHSWLLGMQPWDTIRSYSADAEETLRRAVASAGADLYAGRCELPYEAFFDCVPTDHMQFFESLRLYHRNADGVFAHGGVDPRVAELHGQPREALIWGAGGFPNGYDAADTLVYGHWNNAVVDDDGWPSPRVVGRTVGIDTIRHGVLTAIRLPDRRVFQSARHGRGGES